VRIPDISVSSNILQSIRDLDAKRFQLNDQISSGQKISLPSDDGVRMSRVIQLDSEKSKLAQYQRNSSFAQEYINASQMNLEKLRELSQRGQEIARLAGTNLNGPAIEGFGIETNQLIEEALNRINSKQRGRALFGGTEIVPEFANSDVIYGKFEQKNINFRSGIVGVEGPDHKQYLKQGDELSLRVNGREFVVQTKVLDKEEYEGSPITEEIIEINRNFSIPSKVSSGKYYLEQGDEGEISLYRINDGYSVRGLPSTLSGEDEIFYSNGVKIGYQVSLSRDFTLVDQFLTSASGLFSVDGDSSNSIDLKYDPLVEFPVNAENPGDIFYDNGFKVVQDDLTIEALSYNELSNQLSNGDLFKVGNDLHVFDLSYRSFPSASEEIGEVYFTQQGFRILEANPDPDLPPIEASVTEDSLKELLSHGDYFEADGIVYQVEVTTQIGQDEAGEEVITTTIDAKEVQFLLGTKLDYSSLPYPNFSTSSSSINELFYQDGFKLNQVTGKDSEGIDILEAVDATKDQIVSLSGLSAGSLFTSGGKLFHVLPDGVSSSSFSSPVVEKQDWNDWKEQFATLQELKYNEGDIVKVTSSNDDAIAVDPDKFPDLSSVIDHIADFSWSSNSLGSANINDQFYPVYQLSRDQVNQLGETLSGQPTDEQFPLEDGIFALVETGGKVSLEPVTNAVDFWNPAYSYQTGDLVRNNDRFYTATVDHSPSTAFNPENWANLEDTETLSDYQLTANDRVSYWQATKDQVYLSPGSRGNHWIEINPNFQTSNVTIDQATELFNSLVNDVQFSLDPADFLETEDYVAFVRPSRLPDDTFDSNLELFSEVSSKGDLLISGTAGRSFSSSVSYKTAYDGERFFPNQLEGNIKDKARSLFPEIEFENLSSAQLDRVWSEIRNSKVELDLQVGSSSLSGVSEIFIEHSQPWKRLSTYGMGSIIEHNGKLWESISDENIAQTPSSPSEFWKEIGSDYSGSREDWTIEMTGVEGVEYFLSPDGKLFEDQDQAYNHTFNLIYYSSVESFDLADQATYDYLNSLIKKFSYPMSQYAVQGSESDARVVFNQGSQKFHLEALFDGDVAGTNSAQHVLTFSAFNDHLPEVLIQSPGSMGVDASASVITDVDGSLVGLRVDDPGRYFFSSDENGVEIPAGYETATITIPNQSPIEAKIIWGEDFRDPGVYKVLGFDLLEDAKLQELVNPRRGDSFSFSTGSKTFLDHRDKEGNLIGVTYTGSEKDAEFYVGKDSKMSSLLSSENGNTAELASVVNSLVQLRDSLDIVNPSDFADSIQQAEATLIDDEDAVLSNIGELSSMLVKLNSIKDYDEDFHLQLDQRLSKDLDIDLSDAIMELTRISTAYQAAMQVGAQLLNTSLLNYL
jgi:flagellin-like hook-associated protein FlgL